MIKNILFDLDGTLLPMDLEEFTKIYFKKLHERFAELGYNADIVLKAVMAGTKVMMENNGEASNEEVFWNAFKQVSGVTQKECEEDFTNFYKNDFSSLGKFTGKNENMVKAVHLLKEKGYQLYLTTNPLFPKMAVEERVCWAGLKPSMFSLLTSYEYCRFTKPNINYYKDVIENEHLLIEECMMVGNDAIEDGVIENLGIPLYLVEDHLINRDGSPLSSKWHGTSSQFLTFAEQLPRVK